MPDLNLIDDEEFEESSEPVAVAEKPKMRKPIKKSGGGGAFKIILIFIIIGVLGAAAYFAHIRGYVNISKLIGKKQPPVVQIQDEAFVQETNVETIQDTLTTESQTVNTDTVNVSLMEPDMVEEKPEPVKPKSKTKKEVVEEDAVDMSTSTTLSEMSGEFTIQVIAFKSKLTAHQTAKNLEYAGYPSFVEKVPMKGGEFYTVRVGKYPTRKAAENAVKKFPESLKEHYVIDKIRSQK